MMPVEKVRTAVVPMSPQDFSRLYENIGHAMDHGWECREIEYDPEMGESSSYLLETYDEYNELVHTAWYADPYDLVACLYHMYLLNKLPDYVSMYEESGDDLS